MMTTDDMGPYNDTELKDTHPMLFSSIF